MGKLDGKSKIQLLVGLLIVAVVLLAAWAIWRTQINKVDCSEIISMVDVEECVGTRLEAVGILECERAGVPPKAAVHYLKFEDGTELRFLEEYAECESYDGKKVRVTGELYRATEFDQGAGVGLIDIESVGLAE